MNLLPGQACFQVPEVEIAVYIPEDEGITLPGDARNTAHTALCNRSTGNIHGKESGAQINKQKNSALVGKRDKKVLVTLHHKREWR